MNKLKENKGVSLAAFVITILVILLIIAVAGCVYFYKLSNNDIEMAVEKNNDMSNSNMVEEDKDISNSNLVEEKNIEKSNIYNIKYEEEYYRTYDSNNKIVSESKRNIPTIINSSNQTAADLIQKSLIEISNKEWNDDIKKNADEITNEIKEGGNSWLIPGKEPYIGANYLISTANITEKFLTFEIKLSGNFGGVNWNGDELYLYDTATGKIIEMQDITSNLSGLKNLILKRLKEYVSQNNISLQINNDNEILEIISKAGNWGIVNGTLIINFPEYSIASGADGIISILIDKSTANTYLKDKYKL